MSQKRDQLLQTGEALFIKHGMRRVTVEEICRQAGVSKPTFYKYFQNKAALARAIDALWIDESLTIDYRRELHLVQGLRAWLMGNAAALQEAFS